MKYVLAIDQSTQGTKIALLDDSGRIVSQHARPHRQIVDKNSYVSHDANEIYNNLIVLVKEVIQNIKVKSSSILAVGISNQRETSVIWDKTGQPLNSAVVWQCARAEHITKQLDGHADVIKDKTGLPLSPYFSAAKFAWLMRNTVLPNDGYCLGTMDSYLVYRLTKGKTFATDYSNASRTQLFNIKGLKWDSELCELFGISKDRLPKVLDSNANFGHTDFDGVLDTPIPIMAVMGDSHSALCAQNCRSKGTVKVTYGTGSSVMMNIGSEYIKSQHGLATSLAWCLGGKADYVLEGNINYTGAVISWLKNDIGIIKDEAEIEPLIKTANPADETVLVPAFSGLSAPYWNDKAKALLYGMTRMTGRAEIVKAAVESIAFQVNDILSAMKGDTKKPMVSLKADGGASTNFYLMQMQSDLADAPVFVSQIYDLSLCGVAFLAGKSVGLYCDDVFSTIEYNQFLPSKARQNSQQKWSNSIQLLKS